VNRTDQAHQWTIYAVLMLFSVTACYTWAITGTLSAEAFVGLASNVILYFFNRPKPGNGGNGPPPTS
jgi:hypothetical protein